MKEFSPSFTSDTFEYSAFDELPDNIDLEWAQQQIAQTAMLNNPWPSLHSQNANGALPMGARMLPHELQHYHNMGYSHHDAWSDYDSNTPSEPGYQNDGDCYLNVIPAPSRQHLQLPGRPLFGADPTYSPHSSLGGLSPREHPKPSPIPMQVDEPGLTGPVPLPSSGRKSATSPSARHRGSSDSDGDFVPKEDSRSGRAKRQRIPHTAVEKRYRENLNAHLDKLRQTVPSLSANQGSGAVKAALEGNGGKPSKCEILNGAIQHIGSLDRENAALRNEVQMLRSRIGDSDGWNRGNLR